MSIAIRVRNERDIWKAAWQHLEAFLDRINEQRDTDEDHVNNIVAVLPVAKVLEQEKFRTAGVSLKGALEPRAIDANHPKANPYQGGDLDSSASDRIPGVEEGDFAVAGFAFDSSLAIIKTSVDMVPTTQLFSVWDDQALDFLPVALPEYSFGALVGTRTLPFGFGVTVGTDGTLFAFDARVNAMNGGDISIKSWSKLWSDRSTNLKPPKNPPTLTNAQNAQSLNNEASALDSAKGKLTSAGITMDSVDTTSSAMRVAAQAYLGQGATPLPIALVNLAVALSQLTSDVNGAIDPEMLARIQYPDGTARLLRMMEWSLVTFWPIRLNWFNWRKDWLHKVLFDEFLFTFAINLNLLIKGGAATTFAPEHGLEVSVPTAMGATTLSVRRKDGKPFVPENELLNLLPGQIVIAHGARPAAIIVLGWGYGPPILNPGKKAVRNPRLKIASLLVSIAAGSGLKGTPGLLNDGVNLDAQVPSSLITAEDQKFGENGQDPEADGLTQQAVALSTRLQLILPKNVRQDWFPANPQALIVPAPYPDVAPDGVALKVTGPVQTTDTNLTIEDAPSAALTDPKNSPPIARAGELMLIRGADENGHYWQGVVEVAGVTIQKKKDVASALASGTPPPPDQAPGTIDPTCCDPDDLEAIVAVRQLFLDNDLVSDVSLRRDFQGFGSPSLAIGKPLPTVVDPNSQITLSGGKLLFRDPELKAAVKILSDWIMGSM